MTSLERRHCSGLLGPLRNTVAIHMDGPVRHRAPQERLASIAFNYCPRWNWQCPIKKHTGRLEGGEGVRARVANNRRSVVSTSILIYMIDDLSNGLGNGGTPCEYCEVCVFQFSSFAPCPSRSCRMADAFLQRYSRTCQYNAPARRNPTGSSSSISIPLSLTPNNADPDPFGELGPFHTPVQPLLMSSFDFNFSQYQPDEMSSEFSEGLIMSPGQLNRSLGVSSHYVGTRLSYWSRISKRSSNLTHFVSTGTQPYLWPPRIENYTILDHTILSVQAFPSHILERVPRPASTVQTREKTRL